VLIVNDKEELYESLVRLWLLLIFTVTLVAGTVGLILICRMLVDGERPQFMNSYRQMTITYQRSPDA
jgi:hypothetical protein